MARTTITIQVAKDRSLGRDVFRGSAPARKLVAASWIDFFDRKTNWNGYQRPFDQKRSQNAADYATNQPSAFWPESILSIRPNSELDDDHQLNESEKELWRVDWRFDAESEDGKYGTLTVEFEADATRDIDFGDEGQIDVPWRKAFAQVDCQHRLGMMKNSDSLVTFCIFADMDRYEEMKIFKTINDTQRRVSTSLVDTITMLSDPNRPPHISWGWKLNEDVNSPFHAHVNLGGRSKPAQGEFITFRGLNVAVKKLVPARFVSRITEDFGYECIVNFWRAVQTKWQYEFVDRTGNKLQQSPGIGGLARFGRRIIEQMVDQNSADITIAEMALTERRNRKLNWSSSGPLATYTGKGGQTQVFEYLEYVYAGTDKPEWLT